MMNVDSTFDTTLQTSYFISKSGLKIAMFIIVEKALREMVWYGRGSGVSETEMNDVV